MIRPLDPQTLKGWLDHDQAVLIDVREEGEVIAERVEPATFVPLSSFRPDQVPAAPGKKLVILCHAGVRSRMAGLQMIKAGCGDVWNLEGGIMAWKAAGLPTVKGGAGLRPGKR